MARTTVSKRLVFHVGGYDPITPHAGAQRRFVREIARFQLTWSVKASIDGLHDGADPMKWSVTTTGPNWQVETDYHLVRWDDVIETFSRRTIFWRIPLGIIAFLDFVVSGALWGYLRTNWHYAGFFLYPFVMFGALILVASLIGVLALKASGSIPVGIVVSCRRCSQPFWLALGAGCTWIHFSTIGFFLANIFERVIGSSSKDWTDWPRRSSQRLVALTRTNFWS